MTTRAQTTTPQPTTDAQTTTEAQTTTQETAETEQPEDTGRLSDGEYATFQRVQAEVVDESLQFSEEFQACGVIGQSGDLAGFRECVQSGYSGFEEDADSALFTARDLLDHTDKQCRAALNSYAIVLADYTATVTTAYEVANRLDLDAMTPAFKQVAERGEAVLEVRAQRASGLRSLSVTPCCCAPRPPEVVKRERLIAQGGGGGNQQAISASGNRVARRERIGRRTDRVK